jgi:hypothetical protein
MAWPMMKKAQISPDGRHRCAYSIFFCKNCLQRPFCCLFSLSSLEQVIYKAIPPDISYAQDAQVHLLLRNSDPKCDHDPHPLQIVVTLAQQFWPLVLGRLCSCFHGDGFV